ncbi:MAG: hypothetical protein PHQ41_04030 [Candidatus Cloacimonetes bacterium]|nr:hypothetical protein [Candidatus Cloacimonadota bacterium]
MVSEAEAKIGQTEEVIDIMRLAGEDVTDEESAIADLKERIAKYRGALANSR